MSHASSPEPLPEWLTRSAPLPSLGPGGRRPRRSALARTLEHAAHLWRDALASEALARRRGFLQRTDPRAKLLALLALLIATGLVHHVLPLVALYAATVALGRASALPVGTLLKRTWIFVPLFTAVVALPAIFSPVTPGHVVLALFHWHGEPVGITAPGLETAARLVARVACSVSLVLLVTLTTRWARLLDALRGLAVPPLVVTLAGMTYRYLFLLISTAADLLTARRARTPGATPGAQRTSIAATCGLLFAKTSHLADEVHRAMLARGWNGRS